MKKKVYICASWEDLDKIKEYVRYTLKMGVAPVVPQYYQLALDMSIPEERKEVKSASTSLLWFSDEIWIFGEQLTEEMKEVIGFGKNMHIRTRKIGYAELNKILGGTKNGKVKK